MSDLLNKASLVMVPSGYKEDTVYSVVPTDGSGDLSFTRASNGTRINSAGLVEVTPWNLLLNTNTFSSWSLEGGTLTSGFTAPDGSSTAYKYVQPTFGSGLWATLNLPIMSAGTGATLQIWVKSVSGSNVTFYLGSGYSSAGVSQKTATSQWQLFTVSYAFADGGSMYVNSISDTTNGIYIWHPQVNVGLTAKPYFPTTDRLNVPRLTYQNGGGGCPSLLLEKQSTNLALYSEDFTNAAYIQSVPSGTLTITANYSTSPDGTQNADRLQYSGGSQYTQLYQLLTHSTNVVSIYVKSNTSSSQTFRLWGNDFAQVSSNLTATPTWQRFDFAITGSGTKGVGFCTDSSGNALDISIWGFQFEASSYPTSYIPTTSSSATRVADACYKTGISSLIGQTSGAAFIEFNSSFLESYTQRIFTLSDGTTNNVIGFQLTGANQLTFYVENGGTNQVVISKGSPAITLGSNVKIAAAYANNDFVFYVNGTQIGTDTSGSVPATSQLRFSEANASAFYLGLIKQVCLFPTRLTNAELQAITTI